ncbi:MAG: exodeoxyribonuclease VII large subunit [Verrucomicrobiota bacterium]
MSQSSSKPLSVSELTFIIKDLLEASVGAVWIEGEISNFRRQSSGHLYFTLKDADAQLSVVMFRSDAEALGFAPKDGMQVIAHGDITVYPPRGNYQLKAYSLKPKGKGTLQEQFEVLKKKLSEEGLFDPARKKNIPVFPQKVGIITSPTGAAIQDFLNILTRRCPRISIQVFGVKVQGEGSAEEIVDALHEFNQRDEVDVIILARGGGSLEDLWSFNEEKVVRAVAASRIPTISGVGHEIDFTLCDFAADLRAPTPSAAAELLSRADAEWQNVLSNMRSLLSREAVSQINELRLHWRRLAENRSFREPVRLVEQYFQRLDELSINLQRITQHSVALQQERWKSLLQRWRAAHPKLKIDEARKNLRARIDQLRLLSPQETLQRGYAIVFDSKHRVVKTRRAAIQSKNLTVRLSDGDVGMSVKE